jgi:UDPglucose 6-dehydrogenase
VRVSVIGAGYVGLVTGACLAELGHEVVCVDTDADKVERINEGQPPIHEPGLPELVSANVGRRLTATTDSRRAVLGSEASFITVGTPHLRFVESATREIGAALKEKWGYHLVVVKSTVVPGTTDELVVPLLEHESGKRAGADFGVGVNPEFLTEGQAVEDFMDPDRIVVGGIDERSVRTLEALYGAFPATPKIRTTPRTAEMIKYASNALLATMISFSNEIADLCASLGGVDVVDVMRGVHASRYLTGPQGPAPITAFLQAGCGFGGSCLPKDVRALVAHGRDAGRPMELLDAVLRVNAARPREVVDILERRLPRLSGARIAILGLAYKPGTDDTRESPALPLIEQLRGKGAEIKLYDPVAKDAVRRAADGERMIASPTLDDAIRGVDAVVLVTRWPQFEALPALLAAQDHQPLVIDGRRMLDPHSVAHYGGIGRA